ncbi:MAG TPA: HDIG domain-containing protein [Bacteroidia bacterium]|nr:HDIG domain-containing protein [Bacteroidia bacterium]
MRNFFIYLSNKHEAILKGILIAVTVFAITAILPHKPRYKFDFQKGKVWNNNDFYAPFDFTIRKDPDSLKAEIASVKEAVPLYFRKDTTVRIAVINALTERIAADPLFSDSVSILNLAEQTLNTIYFSGITSLDNRPPVKADQRVVILTGTIGKTRYGNSLLDVESAVQMVRRLLETLPDQKKTYLLDLIESLIRPDLTFDKGLTEQVTAEEVSHVLPTRGVVQKGQLIISRGQTVDQETWLVLWSLKSITEQTGSEDISAGNLLLGQILMVAIALAMLLLFLALLRKDIFSDNRKLSLLFFVIILFTFIYSSALQSPSLNPYLVPLCILPIIIRVFFDTRMALFTHVITVLILGSVAPNGYEFVFMQVVAGMVTIFSVTNMRRRAQLFISAGMIFMAYLLCYMAVGITHEGGISGLEPMNIAWLAGNVLLTLFAYPMIYIFEKLFNLVSDISLMELSDINTPLLRNLSMKAPGTFQHSMQVANLAEEAVYRIGGNALLVRVGALYHDIGKMDMPLYFIENQVTGVNPHDEISFEESATIIIGHVITGIEIARKNKLPDLIIDFIRTHHGTSVVQYFYQSYLKNYPEELIDEESFRYPGPLPFSRETAVLMMADSVEASSRSLQKHDADTINNLVDDIIDRQIEQQQFINSDITFRDISAIKKIFKKMLMSIYHVRVEYPRPS